MKHLPNILTILRVLLTFVFIYFSSFQELSSKIMALVMFVLASLTDYFDGFFARKYKLTSNFGKLMDPIADKILILSAFYIFTSIGIIRYWMFVVIAVREIGITFLRFYAIKKGVVLAAEKAGKLKTFSQVASIILILLFRICMSLSLEASSLKLVVLNMYLPIYYFMYVVVFLTLISGISVVVNNKDVFLCQKN